jgi:hypothetical protein
VSYFRRFCDVFFGPQPEEILKLKAPKRGWILQGMRHFGNYYYYKTNNPECKELIEKIINRYGLNIGLDMHQRIYIVDDNFVANKIGDLLAIQGDIGLTIKVGLFSGLREDEIIYMHNKEICTILEVVTAIKCMQSINQMALLWLLSIGSEVTKNVISPFYQLRFGNNSEISLTLLTSILILLINLPRKLLILCS